MFNELEAALQEKLLAFVKSEKEKPFPKCLRDSLTAEIMNQICNGKRMITGMATDRKTGDVFVRFSFTEEATEE